MKMSFIIYRKSDHFIMKHPNTLRKYFDTERAAKTVLTRAVKNWPNHFPSKDKFAVVDLDYYNENLKRTKKVKNLMSGKEIEIDINTPHCCDPSSEAYWSM